MSIDFSDWRFWMEMAKSAWELVVLVYVWFAIRRKDVEQKFEKVDEDLKTMSEDIGGRCEKQCKRIDELEKSDIELALKIEHVPTHKDIKELSERINTLHGTLSELNGRLGGINRAVDLLNEYHLKPGGEGKI